MKVGIMTFHRTTNFGATLQAVATGLFLRNIGCNCEIVDYSCENIRKREDPRYMDSGNGIRAIVFHIFRKSKLIRKYNLLFSYLTKQVDVSDEVNYKDLKEYLKKYDAVLIGSDMLWNLDFTNYDYSYFLEFDLGKTRKISYATSAGYTWTGDVAKKIGQCLRGFSAIAVREPDLAKDVERLFGRKVPVVCDPTMLIEPDVWKGMADANKSLPSNYGLIYMDDSKQSCYRFAVGYKEDKDLDIYEISFKPVFHKKKSVRYVEAYAVEDFLGLIRGAKVIFTASYHGMLFAMYFHVPFYYANKDKSRLQNIAERFHLEKHNIDYATTSGCELIDWEEVDNIRQQIKKESSEVLKEMLYGKGNM